MKSQGPRKGKLRLGLIAFAFQTTLMGGITGSFFLWSPRAAAVVNVTTLPTVYGTGFVDDGPDGIVDGGWIGDIGVARDTGPVDDGGGGGRAHHQANNTAPTNDKKKDKSGCQNAVKRPILVNSGTKVETYPIFALPGEMGLSFTLYYNSALKIPQTQSNPYWSTNLQYTLNEAQCFINKQTGEPICHSLIYLRPDGSEIVFSGPPQSGPYTENGGGGLATLSYSSASDAYTLHDEDGTTKVFGSGGFLESITDRSGISWTISTSGSSAGTTYTVTHTSGKSYSITYGAAVNGVIPVTVKDPAGNVYTLQMTGAVLAPDFLSITYPGTPVTKVSFKYSSMLPDFLTEVDYNGAPYDYTTYNTDTNSAYLGWATSNYLADNTNSVAISYVRDSSGILKATITNALGHHQVQTYGGTDGAGGAYNGQLSEISDDAVSTCGSTTHSRTYDANGNLTQTVDNDNVTHTYSYAATGQLQTETEAAGTSLARTTDYVWDPDIQLNRLTSVTVEGWSKTTYGYNTKNRLASVKVTNLSGTGTANQTLTTSYGYTLYANGMVHVMTVTHPSPGNSDTDTYTYDTQGNLISLADGLGHTTTYSNYNGLGEVGRVVGPNGDTTDYTYDARGRLYTKTTYPNGAAATWTYGYDGFGLLSSETTPAGETTTWKRNNVMRVTSIVRNDKDGTSTEGFGYDGDGDVTSHTVSRNGITSFSEILRYDGLGRLYQRQGMHGQLLTYAYDGNGNVLSVTDAVGHTVSNQYDALNRLSRTTSSGGASPLMPGAAPTLSAPANSSNGSYAVSWSSVSGATSYTLQMQVNGGTWTTAQKNGSTSFALSSQDSGTYAYRVNACNTTGCGPWSATSTVVVTYVTGSIDGITVDGAGDATVNGWACSAGLDQSIGVEVFAGGASGAGGTRVATATANAASEAAVATACNAHGTAYRFAVPLTDTMRQQYQGQPIYMYGDSPVGNGNLVLGQSGRFLMPAPAVSGAPTLTAPADNTTGTYTVSWSAIDDATSYTLQEQTNGGAWSTVQTDAAVSWAATGKGDGSYAYQVQACNDSNCGPWSAVATTTVALPPASAPSMSVPTSSATGSYTVSWTTVATATSYELQEQVNGGGWTTIQNASSASRAISGKGNGTYGYHARACNGSGCGPWSATDAIVVTHPPASAPTVSVPTSSSTGGYTVSWTAVSTATSYTLQEQVNGGAWTTIQTGSTTSRAISGKGNGTYGYHARACNVGGCSGWSATDSVSVLHVPAVPTGLSATIYATFYSDTRPPKTVYELNASWTASSSATSYDFQYCLTGGTCTTSTTTSASIWISPVHGSSYTVKVRACNASGCSAWGPTVTPSVVNE